MESTPILFPFVLGAASRSPLNLSLPHSFSPSLFRNMWGFPSCFFPEFAAQKERTYSGVHSRYSQSLRDGGNERKLAASKKQEK